MKSIRSSLSEANGPGVAERRLRFGSEDQEAEYRDTHSPLDGGEEPKLEKVQTGGPKDRPITIRLDNASRQKLERLAKSRGLGPSTLAREMILASIQASGEAGYGYGGFHRETRGELRSLLIRALSLLPESPCSCEAVPRPDPSGRPTGSRLQRNTAPVSPEPAVCDAPKSDPGNP